VKRWWPLFAAANGVYALWWLVRAAGRVPLWYDELFTLRLSSIPDVRGLWHALAQGFDFNPPGLYIATRFARLAPLADPLAARLPALVGCALLMTTLFVFLRRRVGAAVATAVIALLPLSNFVERYAIEARAYMLLLGVSGCALVCWQSVADSAGRRRTLAAIGLTLSVTLALTLHVWAVILPAAIIAGEAVAALRTGRIRWTVIAAITVAAPVLTTYPMLLDATKTVSFANEVYAPTVAKVASAVLTTIPRLRALALVGLTLAAVRWLWGVPAETKIDHARVGGFRWEERVVLAALALSPLLPYAYAVAFGGAFMTRYALYAVIGVAGLVADLLFAVSRASALAGTAAAVVASLCLWAYLPARTWVSPTEEIPSLRVLRTLPSTAGAPIVLVNPLDVLAIDQRATDQEHRVLTFVADPAAARHYTGADLVDLAYLRGEPYLDMHIPRATYAQLTVGATHLYLLGEWQALTWIPRRLADDGWTMRRIGGTDAAPVFEAQR
jgi:hypothetical protein